ELKPDKSKAKNWEIERSYKQVHIYQPIVTENLTRTIATGTVNGGILNGLPMSMYEIADRKNSKRKATNDDTDKDNKYASTSPTKKFFQSSTKQNQTNATIKWRKSDDEDIPNEEDEIWLNYQY
ncbi:6121_t:CDS:2, partial [Funneliformis geosporum]